MRIRTFFTSLICIVGLSFSASAADIRPEVGKPLHDALQLAAAHNYKDAMARVGTANAAKNKSADEISVIFDVRRYLTELTTGPCKGRECDF